MKFSEMLDGKKAVLVAGHPGHELRLHGWLELARPTVWVLTDGSGHGDRGRVASSVGVVERAGGRIGGFFGALADRDAYRLLLDGAVDPWIDLMEQMAWAFAEGGVRYVVADAIEGFNPVHDLCRVLADGAASLAERQGATIERFGFPLEARPDATLPGLLSEAVVVELDDKAVERKLAAARSYTEMADEVERALGAFGSAAFRREHLRPTDPDTELAALFATAPPYEEHGARQVERGFYDRVLRFRDHFLPVAEAIERHVAASAESRSSCAS